MATLIQFFLSLFGKSIKAKVMDAITGSILGGFGKKGGSAAPAGNDGGMLGSLMEKFEEKGIGNIFNSWVGKGPNQTVAPNQVREVLGDDKLGEMSKKTGLGIDELSKEISKYLPKMVDKMTPDGRLPG